MTVLLVFQFLFADVEYNFDMAVLTYEKGFELCYASAAANLALLHDIGGKDAGRRDTELSWKWYAIGTKVLCPSSTYRLGGVIYNHGKFKPRDVNLAVKLYEKAIQLAGITPTFKMLRRWRSRTLNDSLLHVFLKDTTISAVYVNS